MESLPVIYCIIVMDMISLGVSDTHRVRTAFGDVVGILDETIVDNSIFKIRRYLGIPYAEPPIGALRYKKPVPKTFLDNDVINATTMGNMCVQISSGQAAPIKYKQSEDCLFLNVYVPHRKHRLGGKRPVMIWIHGGHTSTDFSDGSSNYVNGDVLSVSSDVIVVTFNYRLSFFGFLSPEDSDIVANRGLWDQQLVIKWVRSHIQSFGGDRNRVTVLGQNQGAVSAILQAFYPGNRGMFQKLIAADGTPFGLAEWQTYPSIVERQNIPQIIDLFNCDFSDRNITFECLLNVKSDKVKGLIEMTNSNLGLLPIIDNNFIMSSADHMIQKYQPNEHSGFDLPFTEIDILLGSTQSCGTIPINRNLKYLKGKTFNAFRNAVNEVTGLLYGRWTTDIVAKVIVALYSNVEIPSNERRFLQRFIRFNYDVMSYVPLSRTALVHAANSVEGKTFLYHDRMDTQPCLMAETIKTAGNEVIEGNRAKIKKGGGQWNKMSPDTNVTLLKLIRWWGNFARLGHPLADGDTAWNQFNTINQTYMDVMTGTSHSLVDDPITDFWLDVIPTIINETFKIPEGLERTPVIPEHGEKGPELTVEGPDITPGHANGVIIALAAVIILLCTGLVVLGGLILCLKVKQARMRKESGQAG